MAAKHIDFSTKGKAVLKRNLWVGFISSVLLTLFSYYLVVAKVISGTIAPWILLGLAAVQGTAQMVLFLHLGDEPSPKWNLLSFLFMLVILLVVVAGSIWIMISIRYNLMPGMGGV